MTGPRTTLRSRMWVDRIPRLFPSLTPSEDLVLEVLAGRYRTGESFWTFKTIHNKAIDSLLAKNLVWTMHGVVEKTIRVGLTDEGKTACLSDSYTAPAEIVIVKRRAT